MIDSFTPTDFEQALQSSTAMPFTKMGYVQGELTYTIPLDSKVVIEIRSTIIKSGMARRSEQETIRLWLREINSTLPLGKLDKNTQSTAGWQSHLCDKIKQLQGLRALAGDCPVCGNPAAVWIVQNGTNEGKTYAKCMKDNKWLKWVKITTDGVQKTKTVKKVVTKGNALAALEATEIPVVLKKEINPTSEQVDIRDALVNTTDNLCEQAYAGTGKTSTNVWAIGFIPEKSVDLAMMVFAKSNQRDMKEKLPTWVPALTTHAAGFADIRAKFKHIKVDEDGNKEFNILLKMCGWDDFFKDNHSNVTKLVSLCKNTMRTPTKENLDYLSERFNIQIESQHTEQVYSVTAQVYEKSLADTSLIGFDDMLAMPALGIVPIKQREMLIIDEYQDNNDAQRSYYLQTGARIAYVGDKHQSIMGFRGAMLNGMSEMQAKLNAKQLPLSISWRCPNKVIELAQTIVPGIRARDNAPDGIIQNISQGQFFSRVAINDLVICRLNAPLVKPAFELIRQGIKVTILGREIGKGLTNLSRKIQRKHGISNEELNLLLIKLQEYTAAEANKLRLVYKDSQAALLDDQFETILALSSGCGSIRELESRIDSIFSDKAEGIVFSTCHKAKGGEADNVFILEPDLLKPQKWDKQSWELEQLQHLNYVAWTRAKQNLSFVYA